MYLSFLIWHTLFTKWLGIRFSWVPEGFFFRSEAAVVSGEAAIEIQNLDRSFTSHSRSFAQNTGLLFHIGGVCGYNTND